MIEPRDLALAREIATDLMTNSIGEKAERLVLWLDTEARDLGGWCEASVVNTAAEIIAKHRQPPPEPPLTDAERKAWIEKTLNCTLVELFTCKHTPSIDELQAENERLRGQVQVVYWWLEAELKDHVPGTPKLSDAWKMHSLLLELRSTLQHEVNDGT